MAEEKQFETKVRRWLESIGIYEAGTPYQAVTVPQVGWYFKMWGGGMGKAGIPDLICCVNGVFISVELKAPKGKPTFLQKLNTTKINKTNGIGIILYPSGYEQFQALIKEVVLFSGPIQELTPIKSAHSSTGCVIC